MSETSGKLLEKKKTLKSKFQEFFSRVPLLGWLLGALIAVMLEYYLGDPLADVLGLPKVPVLFGFVIICFVLLIYALPIGAVARLSASLTNRLVAKLFELPLLISVVIHLGLLYAILHLWSDISAYRVLTLKLTMIAIMVTLSLNVINGYMGEFSCSHPAFMALGAYGASVFTVALFVKDKLFGAAILPAALGPFMFPIALILGGIVAALGALAIAIPSFRTRGDYLAIISLAFMFIVKSLIENLEVVGGPRGLSNQPDYANLPTVFMWTIACIWIINNFVRSTMGKALNAVRDDEIAANAMTVDTRYTKIVAFLFAAFWAGVAGGLFAHVLRYVNPGTFGLQKLAEVLAMVYFGGLNSVYGSIVGAVSLSMLSEFLRPLEIFKWIIIPLLLILVMIYRPTGLIAFKEFDVRKLI
ncbi:MAG: branched-chain amino acid ABC transporter permease, partial [Deltaproteobacteria bacterium]|nr:branched-chain amino acid ABC transporter permease [Deltaproteobacteria bacterium]